MNNKRPAVNGCCYHTIPWLHYRGFVQTSCSCRRSSSLSQNIPSSEITKRRQSSVFLINHLELTTGVGGWGWSCLLNVANRGMMRYAAGNFELEAGSAFFTARSINYLNNMPRDMMMVAKSVIVGSQA